MHQTRSIFGSRACQSTPSPGSAGLPAESATVFAVMPCIATQTMLTARPFSNFSWEWTNVDAADAGTTDVTPAPTGTSLPDLSDEAVWGPFPSNYLDRMSKAYGRWYSSKMQKYEVAAYRVQKRFGDMAAFADSWVRPRFSAWLRDRHLHQHLEPLQQSGCMEMQFGQKRFDFIKYKYMPSAGKPSFPQQITVFSRHLPMLRS